jgi:hypothetical protein
MVCLEDAISRKEAVLNDRLEKATGWPCIVSRVVPGYTLFAWTDEDGGPMLEVCRDEDLLSSELED